MSLSNSMLDQFLTIGKWSETADDNIAGEEFSLNFFHNIYTNWQANPDDQSAIDAIGLIPLGIAIAGWGVSDAEALPRDPNQKKWQGTKSTASGKHLMSYAKGGVGIPHADSNFLKNIIEEIKNKHQDIAPKFDQFYALKGTNFDKLYANGGHCEQPVVRMMTDLNGEPFNHTKWGFGGDSYCATYNTKTTTTEDWRVFKHWIRAALRLKDMQLYIITYWIENYWQPSYSKTIKVGGTIPEAIVNCRIRNSGSGKANKVVGKSIDEQLEYYQKESRWGVMLRAANIWEAFSGVEISSVPGKASVKNTFKYTASNTARVVADDIAPSGNSSDGTMFGGLANMLSSAAAAGATAAVATNVKTGVVTATKGLNCRKTPNGEKIGTFRQGTTLQILGKSNDSVWLNVKTEHIEGWVAAKYVSRN